jgi:hypothetical protein
LSVRSRFPLHGLFAEISVVNDCQARWGQQKTPASRVLYEGGASMLVAMPGRGPARHQRANQLLRAIPGSA